MRHRHELPLPCDDGLAGPSRAGGVPAVRKRVEDSLVDIGGTTGTTSRFGRADAVRQKFPYAEMHVVPQEQSTESAQMREVCQTLPISETSNARAHDNLNGATSTVRVNRYVAVQFSGTC